MPRWLILAPSRTSSASTSTFTLRSQAALRSTAPICTTAARAQCTQSVALCGEMQPALAVAGTLSPMFGSAWAAISLATSATRPSLAACCSCAFAPPCGISAPEHSGTCGWRTCATSASLMRRACVQATRLLLQRLLIDGRVRLALDALSIHQLHLQVRVGFRHCRARSSRACTRGRRMRRVRAK
jgi:hypothetical protein